MTQQQEMDTAIEKQVDRVREALLKNSQAIILVVPDEFHRHVAQKAFEKQVKNANAATGTVSAIVDAEDELIVRSIAALTSLHAIATNARPAQHQLDGTPLGRAIDEEKRNGKKHSARGGEPTKVGDVLAIKWADDVPTPRPAIGELLRVPTGQTTSIAAVWGYHPDAGFEVSDTMDWRGLVYAHNGEWRLVNARTEYTDNASPELQQTGDVGVDAAQFDAALDEAGLVDNDGVIQERVSDDKAGDASDPYSLAAAREQEELEHAGGEPFPGADNEDEYTITGVEPAPEGSEPLMTEPAKKGGKKRAARVDRGKIGKGRSGKKSR